MKRLVLLFALVFTLAASAAACDKAQAAEHQSQMKAALTKIHTSWDAVQKAATPAAKDVAIKAHGEALAEFQAMHEKHLAAAQEGEKKMGAMMAKMKAEGKKCEMECCKKHDKATHSDHPKTE
jgi:hypothetical protein